jgi:uncharacterized protein (DUF885 family)
MKRIVVSLAAALLLAACGRKEQAVSDFDALTRNFVESSLALSPVSATQAGYHKHGNVELDLLLDDYTPAGIERRRTHWGEWQKRLARLDASRLDAEQQADLGLMRSQVELAQLELERIRGWQRNPTGYVELIGTALFTPLSVEYAPLEARYRHIIARLHAIPAFLATARQNLEEAPGVWTRVAKEENHGNLALIEGPLAKGVPASLKNEYDPAAAKAVEALKSFNTWLDTLKDSGEDSWRLGQDLYERKFALVMGGTRTVKEALEEAEADLRTVRRKMFDTALPLHHQFYPTHRDPVDLNLIVGETLDKIAQRHATRENYFAEAKKTLEEARAFLKSHEKELVKDPPHDNLQLIETPEFMRGIYGVGGFNPAPALEPQLGAFYWLTPIPKDWPRERVESKLREYNDYGLRILTVHEAIPGHYVQFEYADQVQPPSRRLLRNVFGSGVYVEGWAVYATEAMINAGYWNTPEMQLTFGKQLLRAIGNAILDIRLHTMNMTREEAMKLMIDQTFQEKQEAEAKWQRAQLSVCQLPTYYAGYKEWKRLREQVASKEGARFVPGVFHERALEKGALPMKALTGLLLRDRAGL